MLSHSGARSAAARVKKGHDPLEHILVHDRKVSATRAAKLLRLKLNQEGAQRACCRLPLFCLLFMAVLQLPCQGSFTRNLLIAGFAL